MANVCCRSEARALPGARTAGTLNNKVQASPVHLEVGAGTAGIDFVGAGTARGQAQAPQARQIIGCRRRLCTLKLAQAPQALIFVGAGTARGQAQAPQARQIIRCRRRLCILKMAHQPQAMGFGGAGTPPRLGL